MKRRDRLLQRSSRWLAVGNDAGVEGNLEEEKSKGYGRLDNFQKFHIAGA